MLYLSFICLFYFICFVYFILSYETAWRYLCVAWSLSKLKLRQYKRRMIERFSYIEKGGCTANLSEEKRPVISRPCKLDDLDIPSDEESETDEKQE